MLIDKSPDPSAEIVFIGYRAHPYRTKGSSSQLTHERDSFWAMLRIGSSVTGIFEVVAPTCSVLRSDIVRRLIEDHQGGDPYALEQFESVLSDKLGVRTTAISNAYIDGRIYAESSAYYSKEIRVPRRITDREREGDIRMAVFVPICELKGIKPDAHHGFFYPFSEVELRKVQKIKDRERRKNMEARKKDLFTAWREVMSAGTAQIKQSGYHPQLQINLIVNYGMFRFLVKAIKQMSDRRREERLAYWARESSKPVGKQVA